MAPPNIDPEILKEFSSISTVFMKEVEKSKDVLMRASGQVSEARRAVSSIAAELAALRASKSSTVKESLEAFGIDRLYIARSKALIQSIALTGQLNKARAKGDKDEVSAIEQRIAQTKLDLENTKVYSRALVSIASTGESQVNTTKKYTTLQARAAALAFQIEEIEKRRARVTEVTEANQLDLVKQQLVAKQQSVEAELAFVNQLKGAEAIEQRRSEISERMESIFGISTDSLKKKAADFGRLLESPALLATAAIEGVKGLVEKLNEFRLETKLTMSQVPGLVGTALSGYRTALGEGVLSTPEATKEAVAALANEYGRLDFLSGNLVADQIKLTSVYGLNNEEASRLVRELDFMGNRSADTVKNTISYARALARANSIGAGQLLEDMAKNSELLARYGNEGAEAFVRAAASARKIGIELSSLDKFADRVLDVEDFLNAVQKARAFGINLSNPVKLMQLAQANDLEGLGRELQSQIGNVDVGRLGRIQQNVLEQLTGMSLEQLQRVTHSARLGQTGAVNAPVKADFSGEGADNMMSTLGNLAGTLKGLTGVLVTLTAVLGIRPLLGAAGSLLGGLGGAVGGLGGAAGGMLGKVAGFTGLKGAISLASDIPLLGPLLAGAGTTALGLLTGQGLGKSLFEGAGAGLGSLIPGVSMVGSIAGGVGGGFLYDRLFGNVSPTAMGAGTMPTATPTSPMSAAATMAPLIDMRPLETKIDELIMLFRNGTISVQMDGRRVGNIVARAYPRVT